MKNTENKEKSRHQEERPELVRSVSSRLDRRESRAGWASPAETLPHPPPPREVGSGLRDWVGGALGAEVGGSRRSDC